MVKFHMKQVRLSRDLSKAVNEGSRNLLAVDKHHRFWAKCGVYISIHLIEPDYRFMLFNKFSINCHRIQSGNVFR